MKLRLPNLSRFSLRTLFVLLTLLSVGLGYVGWQYQIVRERREVLKLLSSEVYLQHLVTKESLLVVDADRPVPWMRRILGDESLDVRPVSPDDKEMLARVLSAFPEAELIRRNDLGNWELVDRTLVK
jgi:hypothetical protein